MKVNTLSAITCYEFRNTYHAIYYIPAHLLYLLFKLNALMKLLAVHPNKKNFYILRLKGCN